MSNYPPLWDAAAVGNYVTPARFFLIVNQTLVQYQGNTPHVVLPEGITKLGPGAFRGYNVESVYLPDSVSEIADNCFYGCSNLRWLRMPCNVAKISDTAFLGTTGIRVVTGRDSLTWKLLSISATEDRLSLLPEGGAAPEAAAPAPVAAPVATPVSAPKPEPKTPAAAPAKPVQAAAPSNAVDLQRRLAWCELLDCDLGERPWMMESNLFGRADRLIKKIKRVDDQLLLQTILKEAPLLDVQAAALANITDQAVLRTYAFHKQPTLRLAAVKRLEDQTLLQQILREDSASSVRNEAARRLKGNSPDLMQFLLYAETGVSTDSLNRISDLQSLYNLALCARSPRVRSAAIDRLPGESPQKQLLKAAEALVREVSAPELWKFRHALRRLREEDLAFFQMVGSHHPSRMIRNLIMPQKGPDYSSGVEAALAAQTRSAYEVLQQDRINFWEQLTFNYTHHIDSFLVGCNQAANRGERSYSKEYLSGEFNDKLYTYQEILDQYSQTLRLELDSRGFQRASIRIVPYYRKSSEWQSGSLFKKAGFEDVWKRDGYAIEISTSW